MAQAQRPQLAQPRASSRQLQTIEAVKSMGNGFDPDIWHVMDQRDDMLIAEEIMHGAGSNKFIYSFPIKGQKEPVSGISVIGARHLAYHYGGLKHRLVSSQLKVGSLFTFTSFPAENMPMNVSCNVVHELIDEPDFYGVVVEVMDVKRGNTIQVEHRENRIAFNSEGEAREVPHYIKIAQSKAYRNGVLDLLPQDVQLRWKQEMLKLGKADVITDSVIDEKRGNVLRFASQRGIPLDRRAIEDLTFEQIAGLGDAAREGLAAFVQAAHALNLEVGTGEVVEVAQQRPAQPATAQTQQQRPTEDRGAATQQSGQDPDTTGGPSVESPESTQGDERQQGDPARASPVGAKREAGRLFQE